MKLLRYGPVGQEKPGLKDDHGNICDLSGVVDDIADHTITPEGIAQLQQIDVSSLPVITDDVRIGPCVNHVGKFICIGLNYSDHAEETGAKKPEEPIIFAKFTSAICGPNDRVIIPAGSKKTDWEVELGVIIGQRTRRVSNEQAHDHVAGYCIINDISERTYQLEHGGQWVKGKSCDTFAPIGPYLVTCDEVPNPQNLHLWLEVDGKRYQNGSTSNMIFNVAHLVSYLSHFMTLYPGDIISTGTPAGVGLGQKPPVYLCPEQTIKLAIEGLGEQVQKTIAE
ncbi:MAG: fumarylacetoacetate hydrolase family protein [Endozoicomonadaceae bacterium]|nr:fumarylacetoacetate hydrolase family protein [Endozoicomonadaceae bacterium]